ncbi:hypothetical protein FQA39_LY02795 [Lamprigera yunnana]|nr:hypothetical protein FQA39_LY02795 [Lamprigera yunnana]
MRNSEDEEDYEEKVVRKSFNVNGNIGSNSRIDGFPNLRNEIDIKVGIILDIVAIVSQKFVDTCQIMTGRWRCRGVDCDNDHIMVQTELMQVKPEMSNLVNMGRNRYDKLNLENATNKEDYNNNTKVG